jgi:hypothetical protein
MLEFHISFVPERDKVEIRTKRIMSERRWG